MIVYEKTLYPECEDPHCPCEAHGGMARHLDYPRRTAPRYFASDKPRGNPQDRTAVKKHNDELVKLWKAQQEDRRREEDGALERLEKLL